MNLGCEACNSDREHREHKKDRKRVKKAEQQKRKKVTINSDTEGKKNRNRPPMPKTEDLGSKLAFLDNSFHPELVDKEQEIVNNWQDS